MSQGFIMDIARKALCVFLKMSAPILIITLIVGLIVSIIQATTQIQEQTMTFITKIFAVVFTLLILGPWMINIITGYTSELLGSLPQLIR